MGMQPHGSPHGRKQLGKRPKNGFSLNANAQLQHYQQEQTVPSPTRPATESTTAPAMVQQEWPGPLTAMSDVCTSLPSPRRASR